MKKVTLKFLKNLVKNLNAVDLTYISDDYEIPESTDKIYYAAGIYGCNGFCLKGLETGKLYVVYSRNSNMYKFG